MKRIILILTVLAATASCVLSAADAPERQGWNGNISPLVDKFYSYGSVPLYGNVESVTCTEYYFMDSSGVVVRGKIDSKSCYNFNEVGDVTEKVEYNSDGSLKGKKMYKYDSKGNKTEEAWYKSGGTLSWKSTYKYDSEGNMTEDAYYDSDGSFGRKYTYKYDSKGNMTEKAFYAYGMLSWKVTCLQI